MQYWHNPKIVHLELIPRWAQKYNSYIRQYRHNCQLRNTPLDDDSAVISPWDLLLDIAVSTFSFTRFLNTCFSLCHCCINLVICSCSPCLPATKLADRLWGVPSLLFSGYLGHLFPGVSRSGSEAVFWPPSIVEVKNMWSYPCLPSAMCMHGQLFHLTLIFSQ